MKGRDTVVVLHADDSGNLFVRTCNLARQPFTLGRHCMALLQWSVDTFSIHNKNQSDPEQPTVVCVTVSDTTPP
jgi:hypothetical protein